MLPSSLSSNISPEDYQSVEALLGRRPRGLAAIPVRDCDGQPVVIQVDSLVDQKPFPTLFWLVDKQLNYAIDQLEARGFIAELQARIDQSEELQQMMVEDHRAYIDLRQSLIGPDQQQAIDRLGFTEVLGRRGIGGIENFTRIRCLHTYYAAHLVVPNTIGALLEQHWHNSQVTFPHLSGK